MWEAGGSDYSREAIILPSGGDYSRVVINRGAAIILGIREALDGDDPTYMRKRSQLLGLTSYN